MAEHRTTRGRDKRWNLYRITTMDDARILLGAYQGRREANKAVEKIAYEPEPQW